jgi:hypothetical protein
VNKCVSTPLTRSAVAVTNRIDFLSWEAVLDALGTIKTADSMVTEIVLELQAIVKPQLDFFLDYKDCMDRLKLPVATSANEMQAQFVRSLWSIFRPTTLFSARPFQPRPSKNAWYGAHFLVGTSIRGWYGFVNRSIVQDLKHDDRGSVFVIGLPRSADDNLLGLEAKRVTGIPQWGISWKLWEISLQVLNNEATWEALVNPIHNYVAHLSDVERAAVGYTKKTESI